MSILKEQLLDKINSKTAKVGVVGLGYVGLPLAVEKASAGYQTIGFDVQDKKVNMVNDGQNYIGDVVDEKLKELDKASREESDRIKELVSEIVPTYQYTGQF